MRKKAINHVFDVVKTVSHLERELDATPVYAQAARSDCSQSLEAARQRLRLVLEEVHASEIRENQAA